LPTVVSFDYVVVGELLTEHLLFMKKRFGGSCWRFLVPLGNLERKRPLCFTTYYFADDTEAACAQDFLQVVELAEQSGFWLVFF